MKNVLIDWSINFLLTLIIGGSMIYLDRQVWVEGESLMWFFIASVAVVYGREIQRLKK